MKIHLFTCILPIFVLTSCDLFKSEMPARTISAEEYYFPSLSESFKKAKDDYSKTTIEFPINFPEPNDSINDYVNQWFSQQLKNLKEPVIYKMKNKNKDIIRFTLIGSWSNPVSYRIENKGGQIVGIYKKTDGHGGFSIGKITDNKKKILSKNSWDKILHKIESIKFWNIQTHDPNVVLDGEEWILEGFIEGKYHFITRNCPDYYGGKEYAELCRLIIEVLDIKDDVHKP